MQSCVNAMSKVVLISVDGMRPDAIRDIPYVKELMKKGSYTLDGRTVMPSVTLPCHMSMFHSVDPDRHGIITNTYTPQVRPVNGLCEVLRRAGKKNAFFYTWEQLRDLTRPDSLAHACYFSGHTEPYEEADRHAAEAAVAYLNAFAPDFTFLYFGLTDMSGHAYGWMTDPYQKDMQDTWDRIARFIDAIPSDLNVIITTDHGGHGRSHGSDLPEDMVTPLFAVGPAFAPGRVLEGVSIKDVAPTIVKLLDVEPDAEWEGKALI